MISVRRAVGLLAALPFLAACGTSGAADVVDVDVDVTMHEFAFSPRTVEVPAGVTVRFKVVNDGQIAHEMVIGDRQAQEDAEAAAAAGDDHHAHHAGLPSLSLGPGESGILEFRSDEAAELMLGCHYSGHWDAGMRASLLVS